MASNLYWANQGAGTIIKDPLSSGLLQVIATGQNGPTGLAVDGSNLYWADQAGTVMKAPVNGGAPTAIATGLAGPIGVAVGGSNLYWAVFQAGTIMKAPVNGGASAIIATGQAGPTRGGGGQQHQPVPGPTRARA